MRGKLLSRTLVSRIMLLLIPLILIIDIPSVTSSPILPTSGSSYETLGYVTYKIELTQKVHGNPATLNLYVPRWKNWSVEITGDGVTLQESFLQNASVGYSTAFFNQADKFNNSLDYYQEALTTGEEFYLSMNYTLTVKQVRWNNFGTPQMSDYDTGSAFYQLYTEDQPPFINVSDPNIQGNASRICGTETNPVEKARKVYEWVSKNIYYKLQTGGTGTGEKGASWALANREGDCSEYSDLMVALLRAQGVPARKVVGLAMLTDQGYELPSYSNGSSWYYMIDIGGPGFNNITGHAWVEYYIPGTGWVSSDPTWGVNRTDNFYFNYQDFRHIASARGENFGDEINPALTPENGEYPAIPYPNPPLGTLTYYRLTIRVTVLDNHEWIDATSLLWTVGILSVVSLVAIIYWIVSSRKMKRENQVPLDNSVKN